MGTVDWFAVLMQVVLVTLKLCGPIASWSWWVVWGPALGYAAFYAGLFWFLGFVVYLVEKKK